MELLHDVFQYVHFVLFYLWRGHEAHVSLSLLNMSSSEPLLSSLNRTLLTGNTFSLLFGPNPNFMIIELLWNIHTLCQIDLLLHLTHRVVVLNQSDVWVMWCYRCCMISSVAPRMALQQPSHSSPRLHRAARGWNIHQSQENYKGTKEIDMHDIVSCWYRSSKMH